jgi:glycosyltransferase involved in cell wall biosynthesis
MDIPTFRILNLRWRRRYLRYGTRLGKAAVVAAISNVTVIDLWNYFNIKAELCYPYIDRTRFDAYAGTSPKQQIIQISRFARNKNFDMTIRAAELIGNIEVVICGIGNADVLEKAVKKSCVPIHFFKNAPDEVLVTELKNSIALVSPSSFEGLGLTPLEALYCKVPVVLTDLPVFREIYKDIPLYHKNRDAEDMADKIRMLMTNSELAHAMIRNIEPVMEIFTLMNFAERFEKLLYKAVENKR